MKKLVFTFGCTMFMAISFAQAAPPVQEITKEIIRPVEAYGNSIACSGVEVSPENIAALVPYNSPDDQFSAKYAVLWIGDIGCSGGSGSVSTNIAIVTEAMGDTLLVDPLRSSPVIEFSIFDPKGCPKIVGNTTDSLVIDGFDYRPDYKDPACCPSILVRMTVKVDVKGNWKIIKKESRVNEQ